MKKRYSDSLRKYIYKFFLKNIPATVYTNIFIRKRKDMIMKIYVKSAGFSIDQDYSWIDEAGKNISPDASILAYNVSDIQFVWKSTSGSIYLFCNAFTDPNRTDLYNRPLRNYMLLTGDTEEAALLSDCFAKMLLDQKNFEAVLNSSVQNAGGDSKAGFCVDFKKLSAYFDSSFPYCIHAQKLKRFVYERDSSQARQNLLNELWWIQSRPATLLIGGTISDQRLHDIAPDRALLDRSFDTFEKKTAPDSKDSRKLILAAALGAGAVLTASALLLLSIKE